MAFPVSTAVPKVIVKRPGDLRAGKGSELVGEGGLENPKAALEKPPVPVDCEGNGWVQVFFQIIEGPELDLPVVDASEHILQALEVFDESLAPIGFEESSEKLQEIPELLAIDAQTVELCGHGLLRESVSMIEQSLVGLEDSGCCDRGDCS